MFEDWLLNPNFLLYVAVTAGATALILFSLSRRTTETPVQIVAINGKRVKQKQLQKLPAKEDKELKRKNAELADKVRDLEIALKFAPEEKKIEKTN